MDACLHDDGVEGLVDAAAGLEDGREEAPSAQFGDSQIHVVRLGGEHSRAVPVALVGTVIAALIAPGADQRGQLGLDQLLADQADRFSDQIESLARFEGSEQFGQEHTEDHAAGPLVGGPSDSLQNPPLWGTLPSQITCLRLHLDG